MSARFGGRKAAARGAPRRRARGGAARAAGGRLTIAARDARLRGAGRRGRALLARLHRRARTTQRPDSRDRRTRWRVDYPQAAEVANTRWWEQFGDPVLDELIDDGAAREPGPADRRGARRPVPRRAARPRGRSSIRSSATAATRAATARAESASRRLPPGADPYYTLYQGALGAQLADRPVRARAPPEPRRRRRRSTRASRGAAASCSRWSPASPTSYIALRALDRQLEIARATAKNYARHAEDLRAALQGRRGVGGGARAGASRSTSRRWRRSRRSSSRSRAQENLLSILLGRNPGADPARQDHRRSSSRPAIPGGLPSVAARAPAGHPAGRAERCVAANANIGVAKSLYYPDAVAHRAARLASTSLGDFLTGPRPRPVSLARAGRADLHLRRASRAR